MKSSTAQTNRRRAAQRDLTAPKAWNVKGSTLNPAAQVLPYVEQNNALGGPDTRPGTRPQVAPSQTKVLVAG
jgi:hypothetical protein